MILLSAESEVSDTVSEVGGADPAPAEEYEGVISLDVWTMLFTFMNLLLLFYFARKFLFKPIKNMIDNRQKEIDDLYDDAGKAKSDAEQFKAEYEVKLEQATAESEEIMRRAVRNAQLKEEEILKEARDEAAKTLQRAEEQIIGHCHDGAIQSKQIADGLIGDLSPGGTFHGKRHGQQKNCRYLHP